MWPSVITFPLLSFWREKNWNAGKSEGARMLSVTVVGRLFANGREVDLSCSVCTHDVVVPWKLSKVTYLIWCCILPEQTIREIPLNYSITQLHNLLSFFSIVIITLLHCNAFLHFTRLCSFVALCCLPPQFFFASWFFIWSFLPHFCWCSFLPFPISHIPRSIPIERQAERPINSGLSKMCIIWRLSLGFGICYRITSICFTSTLFEWELLISESITN